MKFRVEYLIVSIVLFVVILMSLGCSCVKVSPYYKDNLFAKYFAYEGFGPLSPAEFGGVSGNIVLPGVTQVGNIAGNLAGNNLAGNNLAGNNLASNNLAGNNLAGNNLAGNNLNAVKVEGFEGLQPAPYSAEVPIDVFSQAQGNLSCQPVGYSNSQGPLCLDKNQLTLLTTRGGNAAGKDSEIGPSK
jgi:hypothetical protein